MIKPLAIRLRPGQDLKMELDRLANEQQIEAACILTCAGSLTRATLRYANQNQAEQLNGFFEIVSLTGTMSRHGAHYHIAIADSEGRTYGAHLLDGSIVYTTVEIVIGILSSVRFLRTFDVRSGYPELDIVHHSQP